MDRLLGARSRALISQNRRADVNEAIQLASMDQTALREMLATSNMDEVALKDLRDKLGPTMPSSASAIDAAISIHQLITNHRIEEDEPVSEIERLLETAWEDILIDGKTILSIAVEKELYNVAAAIRDASKERTFDNSLPQGHDSIDFSIEP